jgi:hypothetical protein
MGDLAPQTNCIRNVSCDNRPVVSDTPTGNRRPLQAISRQEAIVDVYRIRPILFFFRLYDRRSPVTTPRQSRVGPTAAEV